MRSLICYRKVRSSIFRKLVLSCVVCIFTLCEADAQLAIKNNLLYDAVLTPNLGMEFGMGRKVTGQLTYGLNPCEFSDTKQARHWLVMPELRLWTCSKFNGHFFGIHAMGGEFNVQGYDSPFSSLLDVRAESRYEGWYVGGGITYGYQWILSEHWNLEMSVGFGYDYIQFKEYECGTCGTFARQDYTHYIGPTKLTLCFEYLF